MAKRAPRHLSEGAVYDFVDRSLSPEAMIEAERHLRSCPECARQVRRAELLFARLEKAESPRLVRDLAPGVVAGLHAARKSRARLRWVLAAEAVAAIVVLAALSLQLQHWIEVLRMDPGYVALRQHGLQFVAEASSWLAPFLDFVPSFPARLAPIRIAVPHLGGPMAGWVGLALAALALGLVGNALLLRSGNGVIENAAGEGEGASPNPVRISRRSRGGRR